MDRIRNWMVEWIATALEISTDEVDVESSFAANGLDSLRMVDLVCELEVELGSAIADTFLLEFPSIAAAAEALDAGAAQERKAAIQ